MFKSAVAGPWTGVRRWGDDDGSPAVLEATKDLGTLFWMKQGLECSARVLKQRWGSGSVEAWELTNLAL